MPQLDVLQQLWLERDTNRLWYNAGTAPLIRGTENTPVYGTSPPPPVGVQAIAGQNSAQIHFDTTPFATSYSVAASSGQQGGGVSSPITVQNLPNGVPVTFTVRSVNANGQSSTVTTNSVTPRALPAAISAVTGIQAWWDSTQQTVQADNTPLVAWTDASGNNYTAQNPVAAQRPRYRTAWLATGRPAMQFNWNADDLPNLLTSLTPKLVGADYTMFVVFSLTGLTNASGARDQRLITFETRRYDSAFCLTTSDANLGGGGNSFTSVKGAMGDFPSASAFGALVIATPYLMSVVSGAQFFMNGQRQLSVAGSNGLQQRAQGLTLGGIPNFADDQSLSGHLANVMIVKGRLSDALRWSVEGYLAGLYAMAAPAQQATI